jgi:hypothetical protein
MPDRDRRQYPRHPVAKPCKLFHRASLRYWPGRTTNLSDGGALLTVDAPRIPGVGDEIELVVGGGRAAVLPSDALVRSRVVRVSPGPGQRCTLAVRFAKPISAAARAA